MMHRAAFTLVEMVGMIVAIGMLLTLSVSLLNQSYAIHRSALGHVHRMVSLEQFVERWRDDMHSAKQVMPGVELRIVQTDNREVVYSVKDRLLLRTRREEGQDIGQDSWQLPSQCTASWRIDDQGRLPLLVGELVFSDTSFRFDNVALVARVGIGGGDQ